MGAKNIELKNKIIKLRVEGHTIRAIMKMVNLSTPSAVAHHLKDIGFEKKIIYIPQNKRA